MKLSNIFLFIAVSMLLASTATAQSTVTLSSSTGEVTLTDGQTLTGTGGADTRVTIADGATITLSGVTISGIPDDYTHRWAGVNCAGDATIILANGTTNTVKGGQDGAGIFIPKNKTLTIKGSGTLISEGNGAGIGANRFSDCGNIIIEDGTITATGGYHCAGIGSGDGSNGIHSCGDITITGGTITAQGGQSAAGIGTGYDYSICGNILISGGTITAKCPQKGVGAGIGTGSCAYSNEPAKCGNITITAGTITATKSANTPNSIGVGGSKASCGTVTIGGVQGAITTSPYTITIVPETYSIIFNSNGGTGSMSNQTINIDISTPLTQNVFTREGYFFTGWSTSADGDVDYVNGQTVTNLASANGTKTLYAKWMSANELPEGMQVDADYRENETGFYYVNMPINNTTTIVKVNDFKFFPYKIYDDGGKSGNASKYQNGYLTIYSPSGYNVILNGKVLATKANYLVTLDVYDGSNSTESKLGQYNYANNISVSSTGSSITLYFNANGESFEGLELTVTTLIIDYTLTYNGTDGATFSTTNPSSYTVESDEITLVNPTRDGYTFLGWTYEGQTEPIKNVTIPKGSTGNKEFVANWQQKFGALTLVYAGDRTTATLQGEFTSTEQTSLEIDNSIEVSELTFQRTFKAGVPATIMLPFDFTPDDNVGKFYTLQSVEHENGVWTAKMSQPITGIIQANTPYIFKAINDITPSNYMTFKDITLKPTIINVNGSGDWTLHGVYEKTRLDDPNQINYGFAGQATDDGISIGDFIRAGEGVWADPMRCYLTYNKNNGVLAKSALDLPDNIRVVFPDEVEQPDNGEIVTPVSEFTPENGVKVWSFDGTVYIEAQPDMDYTIVDLTGRTIKKGITHSTHEEVSHNAKGIVIVKIGNKSFKLK